MVEFEELSIHARSVTAFVIAGAGSQARVLLLQRKKAPVGAWCPVTGRIEPGEAAWQAAPREVFEETRITGGALFNAGVVDRFYDHVENTLEFLPVFVLMIPAETTVTLDHSLAASAWLDVDTALARLTFAGHKTALETIRRDFIQREPHPLKRIAH